MKYILVLFFTFISLSSKAIDRHWDNGGDGISWHDAANWDAGGVPTINDKVVIDDDSVVISTPVSVGGISLYSDLTITGTGELLVSNGSLGLLSGKGNTINNYGSLVIINGQLSIPTDGRFQNRFNSSFSVSGGVNGISSTGKIINRLNADIYISHTTSTGFVNQGLFDNRGFIQIFECESGMLSETVSFSLEKAAILNKGTFEVFGTDEEGIENKGGIIDNEGDLLIYNNGDYSILSAFANGFKSEIYNRTGASMITRAGLVAGSQFENDGLLKVENAGYVAFGSGNHFINNDTLLISVIEYSGLLGGDTLINSATGVILVDSLKANSSFTSYVISTKGYFRNDGLIDLQLENEVGGILQSDGTSGKRFENFGEININKAVDYGIENHQYFINEVGATITIDSMAGTFAGLKNGDTLINKGDFYIQNSATSSGFLQSNSGSHFENQGVFKVNNMEGRNGIEIVYGTFLNVRGGNIEISNNDLDVIVLNNASFVNEGQIYGYLNVCQKSIENKKRFSPEPIFENHNNFEIALSSLSGILDNQGYFLNDTCARFLNLLTIENSTDGLIDNYGFFENNSAEAIVNQGEINNYGVFQSQYRVNDNALDTQDGLYFSSLFSPLTEDGVYPLIFINNSADIFVGNQWFESVPMTNHIANFNAGNAQLQVLEDISAPDQIAFEIDIVGQTCTIYGYMNVYDRDLLNCDYTEENTFTGNLGNHWFEPGNWSLNRVPNLCTNVVIPPNVDVLLPAGYNGLANKIDIQTGSVLDTQSGAVLDAWNGF